jgi:hypothetical protein
MLKMVTVRNTFLVAALAVLLLTAFAAAALRQGNSFQVVVGPFTDVDRTTQVVPPDVYVWFDLPNKGPTIHLLPAPLHFGSADLSTATACQTLASCKANNQCHCLITTISYLATEIPAGNLRDPVLSVRWYWRDANDVEQRGEKSVDVPIARRPVALITPVPTPTP